MRGGPLPEAMPLLSLTTLARSSKPRAAKGDSHALVLLRFAFRLRLRPRTRSLRARAPPFPVDSSGFRAFLPSARALPFPHAARMGALHGLFLLCLCSALPACAPPSRRRAARRVRAHEAGGGLLWRGVGFGDTARSWDGRPRCAEGEGTGASRPRSACGGVARGRRRSGKRHVRVCASKGPSMSWRAALRDPPGARSWPNRVHARGRFREDLRLGDHVLVCSPGLAFVQMAAREKDRISLLELGWELCGSYRGPRSSF